MRKTKFFTALLLFFSAFHAMSVQICESYIPDEHPDSRYTSHNNGTVTDTGNGLMWKVCSEGQTWNAGTCSGTAATYNWQAAFERAEAVNAADFAGHNNWQVPNLKELASLTKRNCVDQAINERIFPNTPGNWYWSSTLNVNDNNYAWQLNFKNGDDYDDYRKNSHRVRLVRKVP